VARRGGGPAAVRAHMLIQYIVMAGARAGGGGGTAWGGGGGVVMQLCGVLSCVPGKLNVWACPGGCCRLLTMYLSVTEDMH
jgi:hypothetical protein